MTTTVEDQGTGVDSQIAIGEPRPRPKHGPPVGRQTVADRVFRSVLRASGWFVLLVMLAVGIFLGFRALQAIQAAGWSFLTTSAWDPDSGNFGIAAVLTGTILVALVAVFFAFPLAFGTALFIPEYAPLGIKRPRLPIVDRGYWRGWGDLSSRVGIGFRKLLDGRHCRSFAWRIDQLHSQSNLGVYRNCQGHSAASVRIRHRLSGYLPRSSNLSVCVDRRACHQCSHRLGACQNRRLAQRFLSDATPFCLLHVASPAKARRSGFRAPSGFSLSASHKRIER